MRELPILIWPIIMAHPMDPLSGMWEQFYMIFPVMNSSYQARRAMICGPGPMARAGPASIFWQVSISLFLGLVWNILTFSIPIALTLMFPLRKLWALWIPRSFRAKPYMWE